MNNSINIFGLGKVGSVMAALYASQGHYVKGYDPNASFFLDLISGAKLSLEPQLNELMLVARKSVEVNPGLNHISEASISLVIVPTPSLDSGGYDVSIVQAVLDTITAELEPDSKHIVVIKSTVLPGDIQKIKQELMKSHGFHPKIVYSPEFIALGEVVQNMQEPSTVLIGSDEQDSGLTAENLMLTVVKNNPEIFHLSIEEAELAKVGLNAYITMKVSFANLLGEAASRLGSTNPVRVLQAIGSDPRVGQKYLKPGIGFGGPCFPRDNKALSVALTDLALPAAMPESTDLVNRFIGKNFAAVILNELDKCSSMPAEVLIVGASYKTGSPETTESQALEIARTAEASGKTNLSIFDPLVALEDIRQEISAFHLYRDEESLITKDFDLVFVALPILSQKTLSLLSKKGRLINPWR
jgi:UDPglucose 6-dehydrogenase